MDNENVVNQQNDATSKSISALDFQKIFRLVGLGIVAIILIAIVISVVAALIPDKFGTPGKDYIDITKNDDGEYVFVFSGKKPYVLDEDLSGKIDSTADFEFDYEQKYAVVLIASDEDENESEDAEDESFDLGSILGSLFDGGAQDLYVINKKGEECVAEDVYTFALSAFGDTILYINADGELYAGELSNAKKASKIDSDVAYINAIAPDGSAFAYTRVVEGDEDVETEMYLSVNGKKGEKFDKKDSTIVAVSNKAKYVYYVKNEGGLYVNDTKLAGDDAALTGEVGLNRDGSQFVYSATTDDKTKTYIVNKAKEKVPVEDGKFNGVVTPDGASSETVGTMADITCYNVASFQKCALSIDDNLYLLKNLKGDSEKLSELKNASSMKMLEDGKTVVFIKNESLRTFDITKYKKAATEYDFGDDVLWFDCTVDGKDIFVVDENGVLCYVKSKTKLKKIADDIEDVEVVDGGKVYFITEDDELYYGGKSGLPKKVANDVNGMTYYEEANDFYAWTEDAYCSVNGKKAKKLFNIG